MVKQGMIIHDRPNTWVGSPKNFFDVVFIYILRIVNFFNPYASTFSLLHLFLNFIQSAFVLISIIIWLFFSSYNEIKDKVFFYYFTVFISCIISLIYID